MTARVAEAALCFVLPKPNLPTNSSLTSPQQHIFGGYNAGLLVHCVASGIPNITIDCAGMLVCVHRIMMAAVDLCLMFRPSLVAA